MNRNFKLLHEKRKEILALVEEYGTLFEEKESFLPGESIIPPSGKLVGRNEIKNMVEASLDCWLTSGRFNDMFEKKLADFLDVRHLLTVNSGSSANLVAFYTLTSPKLKERAIRKGDEVIGVAAGFPTTVNPIIQFGAIPVFVDVDIETHNIDADKIEEAISPKTKAIMLAHALGNPFNIRKVKEICERYNLWLIEDTCDALGAEYNGQKVGTFGDIGTLSFYPAHHITMGEGGAVFSNSKELISIAESFRDWGRDCYCKPGKDNTCGCRFEQQHGELPYGYDHKYVYSHNGFNLKITDMQAACGYAQLSSLDSFIRKRRENFNYLFQRLSNYSEHFKIAKATPNSNPSWFGFPITMNHDSEHERVDVINYLTSCGIGTRLLFAGNLIKQPYFTNCNYRISGDLRNTDLTMENTFWIGVQPSLGKEELDFVCNCFDQYFNLNF